MKITADSPLGLKLIRQGRLAPEDFTPEAPKFPPTTLLAARRKANGLPDRKMNQTEAEYAWMLEEQKRAGKIRYYDFEDDVLILADNTIYHPDFTVQPQRLNPDDRLPSLEYHEVKGPYCYEDARVKFKCASRIYYLQVFVWAQKTKKGWRFERWLAGKKIKL